MFATVCGVMPYGVYAVKKKLYMYAKLKINGFLFIFLFRIQWIFI